MVVLMVVKGMVPHIPIKICFPEMNMEPSKERTYESKDCYRVFIISKNSDYIQDRLGTG